jgi:hypothetical protein
MAEEANTQEVEHTSAAEATAGESQAQEQTPAESEQGTPTGEPQKQAEAPAPQGEQKQEQKTEQKPQSRRSAQFRIKELVRENNELKKQVAPKKEETVDEWGNPIEPTEEKPDPKYAKLEAEIAELKGLVKPVMTNTQRATDDAELSELFSGDKASERAKYEEPIRKMWDLPQYKDLAASDLYKIATYDEAITQAKTQAVEEYKKVQAEAKESSASGSSNTSNRTGNPKAPMSDEELLANNERIKAGVR